MLHFCNPGMSVSISSWYKLGFCIASIHEWPVLPHYCGICSFTSVALALKINCSTPAFTVILILWTNWCSHRHNHHNFHVHITIFKCSVLYSAMLHSACVISIYLFQLAVNFSAGNIQCDNMYISIFSQHNYIFSYVCYNTTCFGPLCGPSSGVSGG